MSDRLTDRADLSDVRQEDLNRVVLDSLRPFCGFFALLYLLLGLGHFLLIKDGADRVLMTSIAWGSAALFGAAWRALMVWRPCNSCAHKAAVMAGLIVLTNCLAHLYCTEEPQQSTNIALVIIGGGCVFLSVRWWVLFVSITLAGWVGVGVAVGPQLVLPHYAFAQLSALMLSGTVLVVRMRTYVKLFELRASEAERAFEMEVALATADSHRTQAQLLIDNAFDAMLMLDTDGRIREWNERTEKLLGCDAGRLKDMDVSEALIAPEDRLAFAAKLGGAPEPGAKVLFESVAIRASGERFPVEVAFAASNARPGIASMVCFRDISDRRAAIAAVEESSKAKSAFLATMSHELRTPLNAIIGYSEMIAEEMADESLAVHRKDLQKIRQSGQHLLTLVNDLLDLSKIEAGRFTLSRAEFDPAAVMNEVAETLMPLAMKNNNVINVEAANDTGMIHGDSVRFRQSLLNLCANACKFTCDGRIDVVAWREHREGAPWVFFEVADTGSGISEEDLAMLFNPYRQAGEVTKRAMDGTGLGLVIARHFCRLMGGDITVESKVGKGSRFRIELPASLAGAKSDEATGSTDLACLAVQLATAQPAVKADE